MSLRRGFSRLWWAFPDRRVATIISQSTCSAPSAERCVFASALMRLASTAGPSLPTRPSSMQRRTVVSNNSRSRSLSRKRPCRFLEKVEWSGTSPLQAKPARPAIDKIEMHFFAEAALGADTEAVADDQHRDHQFRIEPGCLLPIRNEGDLQLSVFCEVYSPACRKLMFTLCERMRNSSIEVHCQDVAFG